MKKFAVVVASLSSLAWAAVPSLAADIPLKAPPLVVAVWNWTGFYVGGNLGYSFGNATTSWTVGGLPLGSTSAAMDGVLGGAQAGYNWQSGSWVLASRPIFRGLASRAMQRLAIR